MDYTKSFYSPHEVAAMASVHPSTILNYIATGRLHAVRLSKRTYRIPVRAVIALLEPERLAASSMTESPQREVADELNGEHSADAIPA